MTRCNLEKASYGGNVSKCRYAYILDDELGKMPYSEVEQLLGKLPASFKAAHASSRMGVAMQNSKNKTVKPILAQLFVNFCATGEVVPKVFELEPIGGV